MRSTTRLAFVGDIRIYFPLALASIPLLLQRRASFGVVPVGPEGPRDRELPQLVSDHRFGDEHGNVLAAVVHGDGVPDHLRDDRGPAGPPPVGSLVALAVHLLDPFHEGLVDERSLLDRPRHQPLPFPRLRMIRLSDDLPFLRVLPSVLPHGDVGWRPPEDLPSPPPIG